MTPEDIERMAREAGATYELAGGDESTEGGLMFLDEGNGIDREYPSLARFAALVRAQALEDAAKECEQLNGYANPSDCAAAIRALGSSNV